MAPPPPVDLNAAKPARVEQRSTRSRKRQAGMGPSSLAIPLAQGSKPNIPN
jgi:hypothetical protein